MGQRAELPCMALALRSPLSATFRGAQHRLLAADGERRL